MWAAVGDVCGWQLDPEIADVLSSRTCRRGWRPPSCKTIRTYDQLNECLCPWCSWRSPTPAGASYMEDGIIHTMLPVRTYRRNWGLLLLFSVTHPRQFLSSVTSVALPSTTAIHLILKKTFSVDFNPSVVSVPRQMRACHTAPWLPVAHNMCFLPCTSSSLFQSPYMCNTGLFTRWVVPGSGQTQVGMLLLGTCVFLNLPIHPIRPMGLMAFFRGPMCFLLISISCERQYCLTAPFFGVGLRTTAQGNPTFCSTRCRWVR